MQPCAWLVCAAMMMSLPLMGQTSASPAGHAAPAGTPQHPVTVTQIHEMMQLTGVDHLKQQMLSSFVPRLQQMMPFIPSDVLEDFRASFEKADFEPTLIQSYQAHLSTEDAAQIIVFYKTPAGQRLIAAMPQIMTETQRAGAQLGQQTMMAVMQRHKAEIQAAAEKYQQEHAGSAPAPQH